MKIKLFKPNELDKNLKVTLHKTGKMGFTLDASNKLELSKDKSAGIGTNDDDPTDEALYLIIYPTKVPNTFRISKAGAYFYINTKILFDNLKVDYSVGNVIYDMVEKEADGQTIYQLNLREKKETAKVERE